MKRGNLYLEEIKVSPKKQKEDYIGSGLSFCPSCRRLIHTDIIKKEGGIYLDKYCPFEKKNFVRFLKKEWIERNNWFKKVNLPKNWPVARVNVGQTGLKEKNVINFENPSYVTLHITERCNSNCKFCYVRKNPYLTQKEDMSIEYIEKILKKFKGQWILLFGGEPTIREDLPEIIRLVIKSKNIPILFTNGIKIANIDYLRELKIAGLRWVYISFDGFGSSVYERLRGIDGEEYSLKLAALNNLKKEKMQVVLNSTIIKGINEDQIEKIIDYVEKNDFVYAFWLRPLCPFGEENFAGFDKTDILSERDLEREICKALGLDNDIFDLWDEIKCNFLDWVLSIFPSIKLSVIEPGKIYLRREKGRLVSLFNIEELREINSALKGKAWWRFLKMRYLSLLFSVLIPNIPNVIRKEISLTKGEPIFYKKKIVKIAVRCLTYYPDFVIYDGKPLTIILYFPHNVFGAWSYI